MIDKVLATVLACTAYLASNAVDAAEMKILCASGMREVVSELQPQLARIAGQQVSISFDEAGELRKRLQGGEIATSRSCQESLSMRWRQMATSSPRRLSTSRKALSASACARMRRSRTSARRSSSSRCSWPPRRLSWAIPPPAGSQPFMSPTSSGGSGLWTNWRRSSGSRAINGTQRSSRRAKPISRFSSRTRSGSFLGSNSLRFRRSSHGHSCSPRRSGRKPRKRTWQGRSCSFGRFGDGGRRRSEGHGSRCGQVESAMSEFGSFSDLGVRCCEVRFTLKRETLPAGPVRSEKCQTRTSLLKIAMFLTTVDGLEKPRHSRPCPLPKSDRHGLPL